MKIDKVYNVQSDDKSFMSASATRKVTDLLESSPIFEKGIIRIRKKNKHMVYNSRRKV